VALREYIEDEIRRHGAMPFSRYMELCLYGAGDSLPGFYTRDREQFGKSGDFYTASDVHAVFGRLLARQFEEMWRALGLPKPIDIIELGPGRGLFAQDVLDWAGKKYPEFAKALRYLMVEVSPRSRDRLQQRFASDQRVRIYEALEAVFERTSECVIVFANEFFDALPTEVLDHRGQVFVDVQDGQFVERFTDPATNVAEFVERFAIRPEPGERIDTPLAAQRYMHQIAESMRTKSGFGIFFDYGYVQDEMFAGRHLGTVTSFRQHTISNSPYDAPGEQDITVHVNFTALASAAREYGLDPLAWVTQAQFLIGIGEEGQFAEAFEECKLPQEHAKRALQLKHLITPEGMGESFHVLVVASGIEHGKAAQLSGLKFVRPSNRI
jgi:SAM-dependent MidA family methyltransferase